MKVEKRWVSRGSKFIWQQGLAHPLDSLVECGRSLLTNCWPRSYYVFNCFHTSALLCNSYFYFALPGKGSARIKGVKWSTVLEVEEQGNGNRGAEESRMWVSEWNTNQNQRLKGRRLLPLILLYMTPVTFLEDIYPTRKSQIFNIHIVCRLLLAKTYTHLDVYKRQML